MVWVCDLGRMTILGMTVLVGENRIFVFLFSETRAGEAGHVGGFTWLKRYKGGGQE
jgi:hypothetical protein